MNVNYTSCCALSEIDELRDYRDPESAMRAFCQEVFPTCYYGESTGDNLDAQYIFTGVEKVTTPKRYYKEPTGYAKAFARFIVKNNLGTVVKGPARRNRINHPNHVVRTYIWAPHVTNLKKWHKANGR